MRTLGLPVLLVGTLLHAQTGPGGVGNSTNNVFWLSADRNVWSNTSNTLCTDGQNVRQWGDRSGNGRVAEQPSPGNQPSFESNEVNGMPVVRYNAAQVDRLLATGLGTGNQASIWAVVRFSSLPSNNPGILQGTASGNGYSTDAAHKNIGMWVSSTNNRVWGRGIQSGGAQIQIPQVTALSANTFYIINNNYDGANIIQYVNNTAAGSVGYDGTLRSWTDMAIGTQAGTENWNGDLAEVIAFNSSLNPAQRIIVANHLAAKYGLALGSNDVYTEDNNGFDHDVAGIGRVTGAAQSQTTSTGAGIVQVTNASNLGDNEFFIWGHDNGALGTWGVSDVPAGLQGRWARTWAVSERNTTNSASVNVGNVDLGFDLSAFSIGDVNHLRLIVDDDGDGNFAEEPVIGPPTLAGGRYWFYGVSTITHGDRFTLGTTNLSSTPLPVELLHFTAEAIGASSVRLNWATASEQDNAGFAVERSDDMEQWTAVAQVAGAGDAQTTLNYEAIDAEVPPTLLYYRLRQSDLDGTATLSEVVSVDLRHTATAVLVPNPAEGPVDLVLASGGPPVLGLDLVDGSGRVLPVPVMPHGADRWRFDATALAPGAYVLRVHQGGEASPLQLRLLR